MSLINVDLSDTINSWRTKTNQIATNLGDITSLNDSAVNIVSAINTIDSDLTSSIASNVVALNASIATLTSNTDSDVLELKTNVFGAPLTLGALDTTDKSSIVAAINELDRRSIDVYNSSGTLLNS
jgi:hypothetical protein